MSTEDSALFDLTLSPDFAKPDYRHQERKGSGKGSWAQEGKASRGARGERTRRTSGGSGRREDWKRRPRPAPGGSQPSIGTGRAPRAEPAPRADTRGSVPEMPALDIAFVPQRQVARSLARQIRDLHLAFPLFGLAAMFLRKPESYLIQFRVTNGGSLWQVRESCEVFLTREEAIEYAFHTCRGRFYKQENVSCDPPKGNFSSVVRCRLDGSLVAPVNYHSHHAEVTSLWRTKFASMPLDQFRETLETVADPALIQKWQESASVRVVWRHQPPDAKAGGQEAGGGDDGSRPAPDAVEFEDETRLREHFLSLYAARIATEVAKAQVPGDVARRQTKASLRAAISEAWEKEMGFPINMANSLRHTFRYAHLKTFKSKRNITYVGAAEPRSLDPGAATPAIAGVLEFVKEHARCSRADLLAALAPAPGAEQAPGSEAECEHEAPASESVLSALLLLLKEGYLVELSDRTLAPGSSFRMIDKRRERPSKKRSPRGGGATRASGRKSVKHSG